MGHPGQLVWKYALHILPYTWWCPAREENMVICILNHIDCVCQSWKLFLEYKIVFTTYPSVCIRTRPSVWVRNVPQGNRRRRWTFRSRNGFPGHSRRVGGCCFWSRASHPLHSQFRPRWVDQGPKVKKKAYDRPPNLCRHLLQLRQSRESVQSFTIS